MAFSSKQINTDVTYSFPFQSNVDLSCLLREVVSFLLLFFNFNFTIFSIKYMIEFTLYVQGGTFDESIRKVGCFTQASRTVFCSIGTYHPKPLTTRTRCH